MGYVPIKEIKKEELAARETFSSGNTLLASFLSELQTHDDPIIEYNLENLIKTYTKISQSFVSIGVAANAEMIRSAIDIMQPELFEELKQRFNWNLERIIDATVKDGVDAKEDMDAVTGLFKHVAVNKICVPETIKHRFPESIRGEVIIATKHPLDELLGAIKYLIAKTDKDILGEGSAAKGNRILGMIDNLKTPIIELGLSAINNPIHDVAINLMKNYNQKIAILRESTKDKNNPETLRTEGIEKIQNSLLKELGKFTGDERYLIVNIWSYNIYKSVAAVHDSILWIGDKDDLRGTASDTIEMLANTGFAFHVNNDEYLKRFREVHEPSTELKQIRVWSKEELRAEDFSGFTQLTIQGKEVLLGDAVLNLGDEFKIENNTYPIKTVVQSLSRKNKDIPLKNSLTIYLNL